MSQKISKRKQRLLQLLSEFAIIVLISMVFLLIYLLLNPFDRGFYCNDETIRFPYRADTVPLWVAGVYGAFGAISMVLISELCVHTAKSKKSESNFNKFMKNVIHGFLFYSLGAISTMLITEIGKHTVGRLRPHFITVCQPDWGSITCFTDIQGVKVAEYVPLTTKTCTGDPKLIKEARLSFPSGHSSFSTYSMVFIILYLEARLIWNKTRFVKCTLQLIAFIAAWHTCMSRVSDFKHHYTDVIAGATIGVTLAIFVTVVTGKRLWYDNFIKSLNKPEETNNAEANDLNAHEIYEI